MNTTLARVIGWLRSSYPSGVPENDYQPLFALLRRRLSDEEVTSVGRELVAGGLIPADRIDVGVEVTKVTEDLPSPAELDRVMNHLQASGVPLNQDWHSNS